MDLLTRCLEGLTNLHSGTSMPQSGEVHVIRYTQHKRIASIRLRAMKVDRQERAAKGVRFSVTDNGREVARAYLYVMTNDLHDAPFGLLEDVYVDESRRGSGLGTTLVREVISAAQAAGCYKLIATSRATRPRVHELYERLGFEKHGFEFRMNFAAE